jgi:hypothetical protein
MRRHIKSIEDKVDRSLSAFAQREKELSPDVLSKGTSIFATIGLVQLLQFGATFLLPSDLLDESTQNPRYLVV